jgi:hypothetical protein
VQVVLPLQEQKYNQVYDADEWVPELAYLSNTSDHLKRNEHKNSGQNQNYLE